MKKQTTQPKRTMRTLTPDQLQATQGGLNNGFDQEGTSAGTSSQK